MMESLPPSFAPFAWPLQFCAFTTAATYVASVLTSNVSQVDRLWTFLPTIYTAYFALLPLWPREQHFLLCPYVPKELWISAESYSPRALLMFGLIVVWMFRLSYNTYRRGLFSLKDEDYRWAVLRTQIPPWFFQVTNLVFISGIQNVLLLFLGIPAYIASSVQPHEDSLTNSDLVWGVLAAVTLVVEFTADNQQWSYQTYKHALLNARAGKSSSSQRYDEEEQWPGSRLAWTAEDADRGFVTRGLWAYSRHPNFACEQLFWWIMTLLPVFAGPPPALPLYTSSVVATGLSYLRLFSLSELPQLLTSPQAMAFYSNLWPLLPGAGLSLLGISSTKYTEDITLGKYSAYAAYQQLVPMFIPTNVIYHKLALLVLVSKGKRASMYSSVFGGGKGKSKAE